MGKIIERKRKKKLVFVFNFVVAFLGILVVVFMVVYIDVIDIVMIVLGFIIHHLQYP